MGVSFYRADITDAAFKECFWGNSKRLIVKNESFFLKKLNQYSSSEKSSNYAALEELYRQLKKNFDSNKDWELSGKAYVSEMEMRKKRLFLQEDYYHWFIYRFYDLCGGYTQDLIKPIVSIIVLILAFSGIYFFIDYDPFYALQRGIKGALPYLTIDIDKDEQFKGYWLIARNIELILGGTFFSFFILALRKRFKQ